MVCYGSILNVQIQIALGLRRHIKPALCYRLAMTTLHRLIWLTLLWAVALPATAADRLAVLELSGSSAEAEVMLELSDKLRSGALEATQSSDLELEIMTRESMAAMLGDMGVDATCVEGQCEVETARNLQAAYVISGRLVQMEGQYIVTTKLHSAASGSLLATDEVISTSLLNLRAGLKNSGSRLLIRGLNLTPTSPTTSPNAPASSPVAMGFGNISVGIDVDSRLREQGCDEEAKIKGQQIRVKQLAAAEAEALDQAHQAWQRLEPELVKCAKLRRVERDSCIDAVTQWLKVGRTMTVTVPAGVVPIQTECGTREPAYTTDTRTVAAADVSTAEALMARLKVTIEEPSISRDWGTETPNTLFFSALNHYRGHNVEQDFGRAAELLEQACMRGLAKACATLGYLYEKGKGVTEDDSQAAILYTKACDQGDAIACVNLGVLYARGDGVGQNKPRAVTLYQKACDADNVRGCFLLGVAYKYGRGVPKDLGEANGLLMIACSNGERDACNEL